jgi:isopentenyl-diphosphate delta-isomerase
MVADYDADVDGTPLAAGDGFSLNGSLSRSAAGLYQVMFTPAPFPITLRQEYMESVVLLDEAGNGSGTADKMAVHHAQTPLHLAFSCYLFNEAGQFLLTRRAESKLTWPGVWTNTCCGHPLPGEPMSGSVLRRLREELGISATKLTLVLPRFRYEARMANGVLENEVCPVYAAYTADMMGQSPPDPDPAEVADARWVDWGEFCEAVRTGRQPISPWCAMQLRELTALGPRPLDWAPADAADLPSAALG